MGTVGRMLAKIGRAIASLGESRSSINDPGVSEWDALRDLDSIGSASGETVSAKKAFSIPAFYQAVSMISGDVAKLPMATYRRRADGGRDMFREHHAFKRVNLVGMANEEINTFKFWRRLMIGALVYNNGYAWIDKNNRGEVLGLYNLLSDRTAPCRIGGKYKFVTEVKGRMIQLEPDEVMHIEGPSLDGFAGEELVKLFKDLFGAALAKRKFSSRFFRNGMMAGGVLAVPPGAKPETVKKVQAGLKEKYSNTDNAFKTLVLRDGYKWFSTQVDPSKAQLHEATEQDAREIARIFNVKAGRLSVDGATSYNADEMAIRDYHDGTLSHWLIGLRCEANAKLRTPAEIEADEVYLDYNINALQWADAKTRSEIANSGIQNGRWSPNETRGWENLNPYEGGEQYYRPLNLEPVGSVVQPVGSRSDNPSPPTPLPEYGARGDEINRAARELAEATLKRAENRLRIKVDRAKSADAKQAVLSDAEELAAVREMIAPACLVMGRSVNDVSAAMLKELGSV
jgi:HK97 family phage portal protein